MGYGNLAYKLDNEPVGRTGRQGKPAAKPKKAAAAHKSKLNLKLIFLVVLVSVSAYFMISKNVMVYETEQEIESLQKQLADLESYTSQKVFELEQSVDLATVEEIATTRLNMQRPEKYQTVYVNIKQDDVTEVNASQVEGVKNSVSNAADSLKRNLLGIFNMSWK